MNFIKQLNPKSNKEYEYVEDQKDLRIPVQSEEAFSNGVQFKAKYIGTQEISRPSTRVEIVTAMRRIRYEFKYRNIKKRKVFVEISVNGIRVSLRKKQKKQQQNSQEAIRDDYSLFIMHYPINRVFYVSHDSQDLKIFSFIARSDDGTFKCSVFKAIRKSTAMNIVRTIGQAFEVCHKLNNDTGDGDKESNALKENKQENSIAKISGERPGSTLEDDGETDIDDLGDTDIDDIKSPIRDLESVNQKSTLVTDIDNVKSTADAPTTIPQIPRFSLASNGDAGGTTKFIATNFHQVQQLYHQQLMHQIHETEVMKSELTLVKEQLRVESSSRADAQARVHRLLAQNRELIITIQKLTSQLQDKHCKIHAEAIDDSWVLNPSLVSRDVTNPTNPFAATTNNTQQSSTNIQQTPLIDFESSVFDNVYQFANFDTNKIPPPTNGGLPRGDIRPTSNNTNLNNKSNVIKTVYSPLKSIYSSESDDVSESSWKDDSQDEDGMLDLGLVATNVTNSNDPVQQFAQNMLQVFPNKTKQINGHNNNITN